MTTSLASEWRVVQGFPRYEVSDTGDVRSSYGACRILKSRPSGKGYLSVMLYEAGASQVVYIHALVLTAFVGPRPHGYQGRHLDGNPKNNHINNLCWGTPAENRRDIGSHGRERRLKTRVTTTAVKEIRQLGARARRDDIAARYGICRTTVENIISGKTRREV